MIRQEAILLSPLRLLDRSLHGGLGKGHLGLVMAPAGAGKSAFLAQLGLDALLRGRAVLHLALRQSVEHVSARYDALFDELADRVELADRGGVRASIAHRRLIWASGEARAGALGLEEALGAFQAHLGRDPATILVDGFTWEGQDAIAAVGAAKACAARIGAELWMTARDVEGHPPGRAPPLSPLPDGCADLVDVGLLLEPRGREARLTLVKAFGRFPGSDVQLVLEGGTLRVPEGAAGTLAPGPCPSSYTLLAGGCAGAEEEFGACAERWGVQEVNFTFGGRSQLARTRGLVTLADEELRAGEVSAAYLKAHLHRTFPESPELRRVLQAIWHQVSGAGEVFAVGGLNPDGTAHGGTGWAVELARHWGKPVHLFDQPARGWFRWSGRTWVAEAPPAIGHQRFAGAGTRFPDDAGRAAIRELFERTFGAPPP